MSRGHSHRYSLVWYNTSSYSPISPLVVYLHPTPPHPTPTPHATPSCPLVLLPSSPLPPPLPPAPSTSPTEHGPPVGLWSLGGGGGAGWGLVLRRSRPFLLLLGLLVYACRPFIGEELPFASFQSALGQALITEGGPLPYQAKSALPNAVLHGINHINCTLYQLPGPGYECFIRRN